MNTAETLIEIEIAKLQSSWAKQLIEDLRTYGHTRRTMNIVQNHFIGLLFRHATILEDIAMLMEKNNPKHWTSVFILFRSLTDDYLKALRIYSVKNSENEITNISAQAYHDLFRAKKSSAEINNLYFENKAIGLYTEESLSKEKNEFTSDPENDKYFSNKAEFEFIMTHGRTFFNLPAEDIAIPAEYEKAKMTSANALWNFRLLSGIVHYSILSFEFENRFIDNFENSRKLIRELLLFSFKTISMSMLAIFNTQIEEMKKAREIWELIRSKLRETGIVSL